MQLYRGRNSRYAPEHTGRIRLCKATFYRDVDPSLPAIRDEQEGETRIQAQGSVEREGSELSDTTLTISLDDGKVSGVARLERGQTSATLEQNLHAEVRPVPYICCRCSTAARISPAFYAVQSSLGGNSGIPVRPQPGDRCSVADPER